MRNKLLNIHYSGGNGGEFFATMMQNHPNFQFHEDCSHNNMIKYNFKRDKYDNLSQFYLGYGIDDRCLTNYSPKEFFENYWVTSPDKWTLRVDHGYGYHQDFEDWRKGLYTDWNVSKTIILNCTEEIGATYCRNIGSVKIFGEKSHSVWNNHKQFMDNNNIKNLDSVFYQHEYSIDRVGDMLRKYKPNFNDLWDNPLKFNLGLTQLYIDLLPEGYDYLIVDPMKVLHTEDEIEREEQLIKIFDYLEFSHETIDECMLLCEKYMQDNKKLYKNLNSWFDLTMNQKGSMQI